MPSEFLMGTIMSAGSNLAKLITRPTPFGCQCEKVTAIQAQVIEPYPQIYGHAAGDCATGKKKNRRSEACTIEVVELRGLEPLAFWLPARRSPN